ncbi:MAG: UDP-N-acetylmuramoyl-tripeptide--D-alanyl-D-alanine ligase [bacterium]|nr:UDP-N-acetylmuramoyl-tripeptide--D-alanyl-D-alanine ligase [bacterium]
MLLKKLLHILQNLNYENYPFLKYAYSRPAWWKLENRGRLIWTPKSKALYSLSLILVLVTLAISWYEFKLFIIAIIFITVILLPFYLILANIILKPLDYFLKNSIIKKGGRILDDLPITVIGIAGSYGKTSAKEILKTILGEKYSVIATPENVNTDIGIAEFIVQRKKELAEAKIFIVEMGAYRTGEIAKICRLVSPDYSILTGINEAHLEKFGRLENTISAKFELPLNTKNFSLLNFNDANVKNNCGKFPLENFAGADSAQAANIKFLNNFAGLEFEYHGLKFSTSLLAGHNIDLIILAYELAKRLGLTDEQIVRAVKKIKPIKHRLQPIHNHAAGIWIIDDSYNGNAAGFKSGLEVLSRAAGRKIALTPGLVEQGEKTAAIHEQIGKLYSAAADLVLLVDNRSSRHLLSALKQEKFNNYRVYASAKEAHDDLKNILRPGDTIIFQNDWPDAYF